MSTVHILPDVEKLVIDWALETDEVNTVSDRIYSAIPASPAFPLIRLFRLGGSPTSRLLWLDQALLQVDVYGGSKSTTRLIAETLRAYLSAELTGQHQLGVVTAVEVGGLVWLPDDTYDPAKPRYTFDVTVTYHPTLAESAGSI